MSRLSAGSLVTRWARRTGRPRRVAAIPRRNLVEHHVDSAHLTCETGRDEKAVGFGSCSNDFRIPQRSEKKFCSLFTSCSQTCLAMERIMFCDAMSPWKNNNHTKGLECFSYRRRIITSGRSLPTRSPFSPLMPTGPCYREEQCQNSVNLNVVM